MKRGLPCETRLPGGREVNREASVLVGELREESAQFRFIRASCLANLKGSIGLMLGIVSVMSQFSPVSFKFFVHHS